MLRRRKTVRNTANMVRGQQAPAGVRLSNATSRRRDVRHGDCVAQSRRTYQQRSSVDDIVDGCRFECPTSCGVFEHRRRTSSPAAARGRARRRALPLLRDRLAPAARLLLSTRDADEDGNPALPSFFVDDVRAVLPTACRRPTSPLSEASVAAGSRRRRHPNAPRRGARRPAPAEATDRLAQRRGDRTAAPARRC